MHKNVRLQKGTQIMVHKENRSGTQM